MHIRPGHRLVAVTTVLACVAVSPLGSIAQAAELPVVEAELETPAMFDDDAGNNSNADDPAIWLHPTNSGRSVVVATAKEGGLRAYSLAGRTLQSVAAPPAPGADDEPGRFNNVDLAYGLPLAGRPTDVAVVSDRGLDKLRTYRIDPAAAAAGRAPLTDITDPAAPLIFNRTQEEVNEQNTVYGLGTWRDPSGQHYALVSRRHTTQIALLRLIATPAGKVTYTVVRTLTLPSTFRLPDGSSWTPCEDPGELPQVEGMVVDAQTGVLYAGQEDVGIWKLSATLTGAAPVLMDKVREFGAPATFNPQTEECEPTGPNPGYGGTHIAADVEGLTIYYRRNGQGYLLASSQGDNTFVVYQRAGNNAFVGNFAVGPDSDGPDGSQECDGAMVLNVPLGSEFDEGLLVVQDGVNTPDVRDTDGEVRTNTNFKFVEWDDVAEEVGLAVDTTGWNPRR